MLELADEAQNLTSEDSNSFFQWPCRGLGLVYPILKTAAPPSCLICSEFLSFVLFVYILVLYFIYHLFLPPSFSIPNNLYINMFKPPSIRHAIRAASHTPRPTLTPHTRSLPITITRPLSITIPRQNRRDDSEKNKHEEQVRKAEAEQAKKDPLLSATTKAPEGAAGEQEGKFARTDDSLQIEYPDDENMPRSPVVQGRGGMHFKRTLALFSLENKVSLVTGGARGLGLVMAQSLVASGSDLAIVDLNSMFLGFIWQLVPDESRGGS